MRLHYLQHVPFEDLANIEMWAKGKGYDVGGTRLYAGETLPRLADFDWLVIMGGPMNIYEEDLYPWLADEKRFTKEAIDSGKSVLGVCLGAQLIAGVLGGKVVRNQHKEIGWLPIFLTQDAENSTFFREFPKSLNVFHWHGDTFDIPPGCVRLAESEGCRNQAFEYDGRVIGLQFHLESSLESIGRLIENCGDEIVEGKYIQKAEEMLSNEINLKEINRAMNVLLNSIEKEFSARNNS